MVRTAQTSPAKGRRGKGSMGKHRGEDSDEYSSCPCRPAEQCDCGKRRRPARKHLYLVLDAWKTGFSIHRIDTNSFKSDKEPGFRRLPETPALRLVAPADNLDVPATAMGGKIIITSCMPTPISEQPPAIISRRLR